MLIRGGLCHSSISMHPNRLSVRISLFSTFQLAAHCQQHKIRHFDIVLHLTDLILKLTPDFLYSFETLKHLPPSKWLIYDLSVNKRDILISIYGYLLTVEGHHLGESNSTSLSNAHLRHLIKGFRMAIHI